MVPEVAKMPTWLLCVTSPMHSAVGRITPNTLRDGSIIGSFFCWMVRNAFAEAVLQANITKGHPSSKSFSTACKVNS